LSSSASGFRFILLAMVVTVYTYISLVVNVS